MPAPQTRRFRPESRIQVKLPEKTASGRHVAKVWKFQPYDSALEKIARKIALDEAREKNSSKHGEWVGEVTRKAPNREYYSAVRLANCGAVVREGDCVVLRASKTWCGGQKPSSWIALVRDFYQDTYSCAMMSTITWFNRPCDCLPQCLPGGTLRDEEVLLTEETDANSILSFMGLCAVLGEEEFTAAKARLNNQGENRADKVRNANGDLAPGALGDGEPAAYVFEDGREAGMVLLCRYEYDARRHTVAPIVDTRLALQKAATGRNLDKKIQKLIKDFQRAWVACLRKLAAEKGMDYKDVGIVRDVGGEDTPPSPSSSRKNAEFDIDSSEASWQAGAARKLEECSRTAQGSSRGRKRLKVKSEAALFGSRSHCSTDGISTMDGRLSEWWSSSGPLSYVFGEYVEAKWDDGCFYQALIVQRIVRKHGNFSSVLVEWLDPEGYPSYWESSGYEKSSEVLISHVRKARQPPPKDLSNPSVATVGSTVEDWDVVARSAEEGVCKADGGVEWYPVLDSREKVVAAKGHRSMWVCTHARCGKAFADMYFLRAHQLMQRHGRWNGLQPLMTESGRKSVREVDCTRSGCLEFASVSVEKKLRNLVVQKKSSEEPRLGFDHPIVGKVVHTGDYQKGFGLYATSDIEEGTFLGHYSGTISQIGFTKRGRAWHYMFHLLNGFGVDGTAGGAFRFMNHCLEQQDPTVRALIVNHHGVPHVALYANRRIVEGEEMLLRYGDVSDERFFGEECGQD